MRSNPQESTGDVGGLIEELLGFHDCMDNGGAGDGRFYIQMATGLDGEQTRLNLRAVLREAASQLAALKAENDRLHTALVMIAHTETEDSFGGSKHLPAGWYRDQARAALSHMEPKQ